MRSSEGHRFIMPDIVSNDIVTSPPHPLHELSTLC